MTGLTPIVNNTTAGTCPHGLPAGACPICSGMGGGSTKRADEPRRPGEMTYQECLAEWKRMQRADEQKAAMQEAMLKNSMLAKKIQSQLAALTDKLTTVLNNIKDVLPKPVLRAFSLIANSIIRPLNALVKNFLQIVQNVQEAINNIKSVLLGVSEKLTALVGEIKNFINKQISQNLKNIKKRFKKLLGIFGIDEEEPQDEETEEDLTVFKQFEIENLKEALARIIAPKSREEKIAEHISSKKLR